MKEWISKDAIPKPEYPKVVWAELSEMPIPCFASVKYDGELTYLFKTEKECLTVNKWGRIRTDYRLTDTASKLFDSGVFIGELYVADGNLYEFLKSRRKFERLRLAVFDVLDLDKPYCERWRVLEKHFPKHGAVHLAEGKLVRSKWELQAFWRKAVKGFEGIVCRSPHSRYLESALKHKPVRTADVVVLGISKDSERFKTKNGMIGSLLCGSLHKGKYVTVGRVGSGFSNEERKALFEALTEFKTGEDEHYIYVKPALVIEVEYQQVIKSEDFDMGFTWRHPVFKRIRFDKEATERDIGLESQFPQLF